MSVDGTWPLNWSAILGLNQLTSSVSRIFVAAPKWLGLLRHNGSGCRRIPANIPACGGVVTHFVTHSPTGA